MSCKQKLAFPKNGRTTCSKSAVKDGYCTFHHNRKPVRKLTGETFECLLCCEEKVPIEDNMNLECGDAICVTCFSKLSDVKCPYCRKDMKSKKIMRKDVETLKEKSIAFAEEMDERALRDWMEDNNVQNDNNGNFMTIIEEMFDPENNENYAPVLESDEDNDALEILVTAFLLNEMPSIYSSDVHRKVHDIFPLYTCEYLNQLYYRALELYESI